MSVTAPDSVRVETVGRDDRRIGSAAIPEDRVSANAWENFSEATVITVPAEVQADGEVSVVLTGQGTEASAQHLVIVAEKFSKSVVVLDHQGSAVVSENIEILVEDGAQLTVISLQEWNDDAVHASSQQAKIGRDAKFKHIVVSLGGDLVRVTPSARFTAPGAEVELFGLYFADAGQHLEQRLFVDHAVANCKSNVLYKGALQGRNAHTVWVGDVLIRKEAEGTDTYEANRNLVLTDGARADSVPNLEIETGLIDGAGHASATGRFDDEHLFYLMARGIPEEVARRLVVRGFLNEIIQQIKVPAIEERLTQLSSANSRQRTTSAQHKRKQDTSMTEQPKGELVCNASEIQLKQALRILIDDYPVAIVKDSMGEIHAIGDTCSHADISLSEGEVEGCKIECWGHGSQFDLRSGEPLQLPAYDPVPVFAVAVLGDEVYVDFTNVLNGAEAPNFS